MGSSLTSFAMSAMIKSVRLRDTESAISYAKFLWGHTGRDRMMSRLLIMSAEDGFNVSTMSLMGRALQQKSQMTAHKYALAINKICSSPNWWSDPTGTEYIKAYYESEKRCKRKRKIRDAVTLLSALNDAFDRNDQKLLIDCFTLGWSKHSNRTIVQWAYEKSIETGNLLAQQTAEVFLENANALYYDGNVSGQALYRVLGECGTDQSVIGRSSREVNEWVASIPAFNGGIDDIPSYFKDGMHCDGSDPRFAGRVDMMYSLCVAYQKYGKIDPLQEWDSDVYQKL